MLTGGLANTAFIGLPMIETFYGPQFLGLGILIDQLGSYFVLCTLGILVASLHSSSQGFNPKSMIRKIVLFVPFQAFVLALLLTPFEYPIWLDDLLKRLGTTLVPIAPAAAEPRTGQDAAADRRTSVQARNRPRANFAYLHGDAARTRANSERDRVRGLNGANDRSKHRRDGS